MAILAVVVPLSAQPPAISQNGVVNTASQIPPTLAGGALARGALFTIYGVRFGSSEASTRVALRHGQTTTAAKVISVRPKRIDAWLPASAPAGVALLTVERDGQPSENFKVEVADGNPGFFSRNGQGWGPALIRDHRSNVPAAGTGQNAPLHPGQRISLLGTGFEYARKVTVMIGNQAVRAVATRASSLGQQAIAFTIPSDVALGCYVPVYALAASTRASNVVTLAIRPGAGACDPGPLPLASDRIGVAVFARSRMRARKTNIDTVSDEALITFTAKNGQPLLSPLLLVPPPGTCTAYTSSFQAETILPNSISAAIVAEVDAQGLRAGKSLTLTSSAGSREIPQDGGTSGYYRAQLGSTGRRARPLFLEPGDLTLSGVGAADVGPFTWKTRVAEPFQWTDREEISAVDRSQSLTVHWSGQRNDRTVLVLATNVDQNTTAIGTTLCAEPGAAGRLTIPAALLRNLPASVDIPGIPFDQLFVVSIAAKPPPPPQAPGLTGAAMISFYAIGRIVDYR